MALPKGDTLDWNGLDGVTGSLTPGKQAGPTVINGRSLSLAPFTVPDTLVAMCVRPENVEAVFVAGHCLKRDHRLVGIDVPAEVAMADAALRAGGQGRPEARLNDRSPSHERTSSILSTKGAS